MPELDMHKAKKAARTPADEAAADLAGQAEQLGKEIGAKSPQEKPTSKGRAGAKRKRK